MGCPVRVTGIESKIKALAKKTEGVKVKIHTGLVKAAYVILSKAKYYCPKDTLALVNSGQVLSVERSGFGSEARVSFGGVAAPYALWVHEILTAYHEPPTCAQFLTRAKRETRGVTKRIVQRELLIGEQRWIDGEEVEQT